MNTMNDAHANIKNYDQYFKYVISLQIYCFLNEVTTKNFHYILGTL